MKKIDILIGLQYGDCGKGKVIDFFTKRYKNIARYSGGPNAGHTIYHNPHIVNQLKCLFFSFINFVF
jgi:adenylosuccinate synthase